MDMMGMMKQARELQAKMAKLKDELGAKTVEATSGGGAVKVVANGQNQVVKVTIDPALLKDADAGMLEDLVLTAVNQALNQAQELAAKEMTRLTGGMLPPGLF